MTICCIGGTSCKKEESDLTRIYHKIENSNSLFFEGAAVYDSRGELGKTPGEHFLAAVFSREEMPIEFQDIEEYLLIMSGRDDGFEIDILRVKHLSEAYKIEQMLLDRKKLVSSVRIKKYLGERYDDYLSSCRIYRKGCYLLFLATGENDRYIDIVNSIL